jgi:hypothetical protein
MRDLLFVGLTLFFWVVIWGILVACERLMEDQS